MNYRPLLRLHWILLFLTFVGCESEVSIDLEEIIGGTPTEVGDFPTVVALQFDGIFSCSGTLIREDAVLTAAHCALGELFGIPQSEVASRMQVRFDSNFAESGGFTVNVAQAHIHEGFDLFALGDNDIGILILEEPVLDRIPSQIDLDPKRDLLGEIITAVGFGINDVSTFASGQEFMIDGKEIISCNIPTSVVNGSNTLTLCYNQLDGRGKCNGDSGGPSFLQDGTLVGVTSFGDSGCTGFVADTRVTAEHDFIQNVLRELPIIQDCTENGVCNEDCGQSGNPDDVDCIVDCTENSVCNEDCGQSGNPVDADCLPDCNTDGVCNEDCGQSGNPDDIDCLPTCEADGICEEDCGQGGLLEDPDCISNEENDPGFILGGGGCTITPISTKTPWFVMGLFFALLFVRRRFTFNQKR